MAIDMPALRVGVFQKKTIAVIHSKQKTTQPDVNDKHPDTYRGH